jgi:hypothetical protein
VVLPNGKPVVQFGKSDGDGMDVAMGLPRPCTVYVVATANATVAAQDPYIFAAGANSSGLLAALHASPYAYQGDSIFLDPAGATPIGESFILSYQADAPPATSTLTETSTTQGALTRSAVTGAAEVVSPISVGARGPGTKSWQAGIAAILAYSVKHTDAERKQVEQWLGNLYGVTVAP